MIATDDNDSDLIKFTSPKVKSTHQANGANIIDRGGENKENKNLIDDSVSSNFLNESSSSSSILIRNNNNMTQDQFQSSNKPPAALLSSITSLLDSTILENGSATLNGSIYDSILSPITPIDDTKVVNGRLNLQKPTLQQQHQQQNVEKISDNHNTNKLNETNLDYIDFIEVNNDLHMDQEDFWLCDPKVTRQNLKQSRQQQQLQAYIRQQQQNHSVLNEQKQNNSNIINSNNSNSNLTPTSTNGSVKAKNPYKWIKEEFEDKNLDKVKRTLLVALDDIAKGYNRRSRSVSTTRQSLSTYYIPQQSQNVDINNQSPFKNQQQQQQQLLQKTSATSSIVANLTQKHTQLQNQQQQLVKNTGATNTNYGLTQSKSIESILNESNADVIESSSNYNNNTNNIKRNSRDNLNASKNNNYATIIKRRANSPRSTDINLNDSAYLTTQSDDSNQTNDLSPIQYDDITDVQIIAKLQEESLRQSVLKHHQQSIVDQQQQQQPFHRGGYSTATITKRVNPMRLTSNINVDSHETINARRDSASSSEHSSFSSNASNFESPYISQSNFNGQKNKKIA
jgi:hypothetical protein